MRRLAKLAMAVASVVLTAAGQITITAPAQLPTAVVGQPYTPVALTTAGGPGPVFWEWDDFAPGQLPPGFTLDGDTGVLCFGYPCSSAGVQTVPGVYTFSIVAFNNINPGDEKQFTLIVLGPPVPLQITTPSVLPDAVQGRPYTPVFFQSVGGPGPIEWTLLAGAPPPGFTIGNALPQDTRGLFCYSQPCSSASPVQAAPGVYTFTVGASAPNSSTSKSFTITVEPTPVEPTPLEITTASLPDATVNQSYSWQFQSSGTRKPMWSLVSSLPGFILSPDGLLSGVSPTAGKANITVQLTDDVPAAAPRTVTRTYSFNVTLGPLSIQNPTLPTASQNVPYHPTLTPLGGLPPYSWSIGTPNPAGLSISPTTGTISGTLTLAGVFDVSITLADDEGTVVSQTYKLSVARAVSISTAALPNGSPGVFYRASLAASGGGIPYSWAVTAGRLPSDLTIHTDTGVIDGMPTAQGVFQFTMQVTDFTKVTAIKAFTITISQALTITTTSLPGAALPQAYAQTLVAAGGVQPVTWSVSNGNLPAGLVLNGTTGVISGTPTVAGPSSFTITAVDASQQTASRNFTLPVASTPLTISATGFTTFVGLSVSQAVTAGGGSPTYVFSVSTGSLPAGLQLGAATGVITGTPTTNGGFPVALQVTDADGRSAIVQIVITVNLVNLTIAVPTNLSSGQQPGIPVTIQSPAVADISGTLALTFSSSVGGSDNMVVFSNGLRTLPFTIPKGGTAAPNISLMTGTVAGTISLTASVPGSPDTIKDIVIDPAVPVISSVALQQATGGLNVVVTGYSNTREVSSGTFTFSVSSGKSLSQTHITVPLSPAFSTWFANNASSASGGEFKLTVPFSVTGDAAAITKVTVLLTNSKGAPTAVSSP